jgi:hypothetical protein
MDETYICGCDGAVKAHCGRAVHRQPAAFFELHVFQLPAIKNPIPAAVSRIIAGTSHGLKRRARGRFVMESAESGIYELSLNLAMTSCTLFERPSDEEAQPDRRLRLIRRSYTAGVVENFVDDGLLWNRPSHDYRKK